MNPIFYSAITVKVGAVTVATNAEWVLTAPTINNYVGQAVVITQGSAPGLYVFDGLRFVLSIKYDDLGTLISSANSFTVAIALSAAFAVPSGSVVYVGGEISDVTEIPATLNFPYIIVEPLSTGGSGTAVTSVNGQTGAVTLTAANVGAATTAQGAKADTALQSIPVATASVVGGVKQGTNVTIAGDGTISVAAAPTPASPAALVGLTAIGGSAATFMRSDSAPAISQAITPTWSGIHTWSNATQSTSVTTGAVVIAGGLGIAKDIYCGGSYHGAAFVTSGAIDTTPVGQTTPSTGAFTTLSATGTTTFTGTTTVPNQVAGTNNSTAANTAFVTAAVAAIPNATTAVSGKVKAATFQAQLTAAPTQQDFNTLLTNLIASGAMAPS